MEKNKTIIIVISVIIIVSGLTLLTYALTSNQNTNELENKVVYVNTQLIFNEHPKKSEAEDELNEYAKDLQYELETKIQDVSKEKHQKLINEYQLKLSNREKTLVDNIVNDIENVIFNFAQEKNVKIVLKDKSVVNGGHDITGLIIQRIKNN